MDAANMAGIALFEGIDGEELTDLASSFEEIEVLTDTRMTEKDDFGYSLFVVLSGSVRVEVDGSEVAQLGAGEFFGEQALVSGDRRNATVVANERTSLAKMMIWDVNELMEKNATLANRIREVAESRS